MGDKQYESKISLFWTGLAVIAILQAALNLYLIKSLGDIQKDLQMLQEESVDVDVKRYRRDESVVSIFPTLAFLALETIATFY